MFQQHRQLFGLVVMIHKTYNLAILLASKNSYHIFLISFSPLPILHKIALSVAVPSPKNELQHDTDFSMQDKEPVAKLLINEQV
jgi:hypothetical protein